MSIGANGMLTVLDKAPLGALPEGVAFSPNSQYVYIGNYIDKTLQVFRIAGNRLGAQFFPLKTPPSVITRSLRTLPDRSCSPESVASSGLHRWCCCRWLGCSTSSSGT
jgi:hypothetical protein